MRRIKIGGAVASDRDQLRLGLAKMAWVRAIPDLARQRRVVDSLADALLFPLSQARLGVPAQPPIPKKIGNRNRAPGGGRRRNTTREVLASDIERAFESMGLRTGRWRIDGQNSPMLEVFALCWRMVDATGGQAGKALRDSRRVFTKRRRWIVAPSKSLTTSWRPTAEWRERNIEGIPDAASVAWRPGVITLARRDLIM